MPLKTRKYSLPTMAIIRAADRVVLDGQSVRRAASTLRWSGWAATQQAAEQLVREELAHRDAVRATLGVAAMSAAPEFPWVAPVPFN